MSICLLDVWFEKSLEVIKLILVVVGQAQLLLVTLTMTQFIQVSHKRQWTNMHNASRYMEFNHHLLYYWD